MTDSEKREACRQFYQKWAGKGKEDEDDRSYWLDILQRIMGADDATDRVEFQKKVIVDGHTKRVDAYIHETNWFVKETVTFYTGRKCLIVKQSRKHKQLLNIYEQFCLLI